ncbi:MAG: M48 family metallopeptidase [Candidatus Omnitrophica bacterium]|nr:M48 family metallopeptidase [Candidatus Omnitrophota bacterium]
MRRQKLTFEKHCVLLTKEGEIRYLLKRSSARRSLVISIDEKAHVRVSAPYQMQSKVLEDFIHHKAKWVMNKVREATNNQSILKSRQYADGHEFLFLGKKCPLHVKVNAFIKRAKIQFIDHMWLIDLPQGIDRCEEEGVIKKILTKWYRQQALEYLGGRVFHFARMIGVEPARISVKTQKRMWGCCDYNTKSIYLNWQIILSPPSVVDYVVVHELCHLIHPNHSKRFWNKVRKILPEYEHEKRWLKEHFLDMVLPEIP